MTVEQFEQVLRTVVSEEVKTVVSKEVKAIVLKEVKTVVSREVKNEFDSRLTPIAKVIGEIKNELHAELAPMKKQLRDLAGSVAELSFKLDSFLTKEWAVHKHFEHPLIEKRLRTVEDKFGIDAL